MKNKVVFFGGKPTSAVCLKKLIAKQESLNFELIAVYPRPLGYEGWWSREGVPEVYDVAQDAGLKIIHTKDELLKLPADIGISLLFFRIFGREEISHFSKGIVNFHPAPLPYYRGANAVSHSIINGDKRFGVSLHHINEGVDKGDIIDVLWLEIDPEMNARDLYFAAVGKIEDMFDHWLQRIISYDLPRIPQNEICEKLRIQPQYHARNSLNDIRKLNRAMSDETLLRYVRAFDFPPFEPAYFDLGGMKVYLRTR